MTMLHLIVPTEVITKLSIRFPTKHIDGFHGYFVDVTENEMWSIFRSLVHNGYRIDVTPGTPVKLFARKETK